MVVQTKNWLVVWNIFPYTGNFIIPTDFPIFQRGRYTTNQRSMGIELIVLNFLSCHMFFFTGFAEMVICLEKSSETETLPGLRNLWRICMLYFMICCFFSFFHHVFNVIVWFSYFIYLLLFSDILWCSLSNPKQVNNVTWPQNNCFALATATTFTTLGITWTCIRLGKWVNYYTMSIISGLYRAPIHWRPQGPAQPALWNLSCRARGSNPPSANSWMAVSCRPWAKGIAGMGKIRERMAKNEAIYNPFPHSYDIFIC